MSVILMPWLNSIHAHRNTEVCAYSIKQNGTISNWPHPCWHVLHPHGFLIIPHKNVNKQIKSKQASSLFHIIHFKFWHFYPSFKQIWKKVILSKECHGMHHLIFHESINPIFSSSIIKYLSNLNNLMTSLLVFLSSWELYVKKNVLKKGWKIRLLKLEWYSSDGVTCAIIGVQVCLLVNIRAIVSSDRQNWLLQKEIDVYPLQWNGFSLETLNTYQWLQ